jgi:transcriptional regulator with XRE-family HTH domain
MMQEPEIDLARALGARLRAIRQQLSLTQAELADELGFPVRSLQDYEAGKSLPQSKRRRRILAFLAAHEPSQSSQAA